MGQGGDENPPTAGRTPGYKKLNCRKWLRKLSQGIDYVSTVHPSYGRTLHTSVKLEVQGDTTILPHFPDVVH
jgi:hypothetical protein